MFRGADATIRKLNVEFIHNRIWQQLAFFKGCNLPKELADNVRMLVEPEDRFTLLHQYRNVPVTGKDIINLLETLNFQVGPNPYGIKYVNLVKDKISGADVASVKQLVLPCDQAMVAELCLQPHEIVAKF